MELQELLAAASAARDATPRSSEISSGQEPPQLVVIDKGNDGKPAGQDASRDMIINQMGSGSDAGRVAFLQFDAVDPSLQKRTDSKQHWDIMLLKIETAAVHSSESESDNDCEMKKVYRVKTCNKIVILMMSFME